MQSDPRTIQLTLPDDSMGKKKKRWTPPRKREISNPRDFEQRAEASIKEAPPNSLNSLDTRFAEIAKEMSKKTPRKKISQDPRI